jgi:hypothetical protein
VYGAVPFATNALPLSTCPAVTVSGVEPGLYIHVRAPAESQAVKLTGNATASPIGTLLESVGWTIIVSDVAEPLAGV